MPENNDKQHQQAMAPGVANNQNAPPEPKKRTDLPDKNEQQNATPSVVDKRSEPKGVMSKSLQAWVVIGLSLLIILLIWLTSAGKQTPSAQTQQPATTVTGTPPLNELEQHLAEETRQQQQNGTQPATTPGGTATTQSGNVTEQPAQTPPQPDPIEEDKKKREYASLFASSVAMSYRQPENKPSSLAPQPQQPTPDELAAALAALSVPMTSANGNEQSNPLANILGPLAQAPANPTVTQPQADHTRRASAANPNEATGKDYTIFEGTLLEAVLANRLDGDFSGPVICMVTNDVYSKDRLHLLVPAGSKLLGETKQVDSFGQRRLAVSFHRLIMPDGYSLDLDQFQGLNQVGETGLNDKINHHYLQIFGASIAVGAIAGLTQLGTQTAAVGVGTSSSDVYRQGVASSLAQSSLHILDQFLNVLPTITIREGHRVKVYLTQDLLAPDYSQHAMPSNL